MAKTAVITRAFNRLEYTVICVRETERLSKNADYEHIIIEQTSTDGTKEWLHSIEVEGFYNVRVKYNEKNTGDAGGMKNGYDMLSDDCEYILQLDNDLIPLTDDFINKLTDIMDKNPNIGTIMLDIEGVGNKLRMGKRLENQTGVDTYHLIDLHSMFFRRKLLDEINLWLFDTNIGWVKKVPQKLKQMGYDIVKTPEIKVDHIDTTAGQVKKFPKYFKSKPVNGTNYKTFKYG